MTILPEPSETAKFLVRFMNWLKAVGEPVGDTDMETAEMFIRSEKER